MSIRWLIAVPALLTLSWTQAIAEPQVLGLLATNDAKALNCVDGECSAEFTSFCMEPDRASPTHMTAYDLIPQANDVELLAISADGDAIRLPADAHLRFTSKRGFAAVRISANEELLRTHGASRMLVRIGTGVALAPSPRDYYKRPHEAAEIARAAGQNREIGSQIVDNGGARRATADLVSKLLNALPEVGTVTDSERASLWRRAISAEDVDSSHRIAVSIARRGYSNCLASVAKYATDSMRGCLGRLHDKQIWALNRKYWRSVPGSS